MLKLKDYADDFPNAKISRTNGVMEVCLHTNGGSLQWGLETHSEITRLFQTVSRDRDNRVVLLTGTGAQFTGPRSTIETRSMDHRPTSDEWDTLFHDGRKMQEGILGIEVPVIAAINGPVYRHMEIPLLSDIVIASETCEFEDPAHFTAGDAVPGDAVHVVCTNLMGINRARYFQLTGQTLSAREAFAYGMVNEVLPGDQVLPRARALAREIARKPILLLRYTRILFTHQLKRQMHDLLGYGLAMEGLAFTSHAGSTYRPVEQP
jgi:enoyl-CoA hydratase/carnithine racemase